MAKPLGTISPHPREDSGEKGASLRTPLFDIVRGFSVASMVAFHFCYDLVELRGIDLPFFRPPFEDVWRASISWVFLFMAGLMCSYSRSNARRGAKYAVVAALIWVATTLVAVDVPINFGIIFCMAASTLVYAALQKLGIAPRGIAAAAVFLMAFLATLGIPKGTVGFLGATLPLPRALYGTPWLSWLGFPGPGFSSGDYYPLLPYCLMYLGGASVGPLMKKRGLPRALEGVRCRPLEFLGRHALEVYILHQPALLVLSELF